VTEDFEYLTAEDLVHLAASLLGGPPAVRDGGLLGAASARPQTTIFGNDAYPDLWNKAAALLQSIVKNHPLVDGNKRLGWLSTAVFLELNGAAAVRADNDDVYDLVIGVAARHDAVHDIARNVREIVERSRGLPPMDPERLRRDIDAVIDQRL
jgi:death-on-curing protein